MTSSPLASIVRVVDPAQPEWNETARARLAKHTGLPHEIIDAPLDESFGAAVNRAAARSRGDHLVVIGGDTLVDANWLEPLLATASRWQAMVTPWVIGLDGAVQSAGHLATRDGGVIALGKGSRHADSFWSFVREVSVPSPSCFAVERPAFLAAGGFDCSLAGSSLAETADLAFALRARGQRVLFQPDATVRSAAEPGRAVSLPLGEPFRRRWCRACDGLPLFSGGPTVRERLEWRDAHTTARLLVVDDRVPHVDRGGGDPRMYRILMELAATWSAARVTLFAMMPDNGALYAPALRQAGIEVVYGEELSGWLASRRAFYDAVMISRPQPVLDRIRESQPQAQIIYDMEAVHFRRVQRTVPLAAPERREQLTAAINTLLPLETRLIAEADAVWCVTDDERRFARAIAPQTPSLLVGHACDIPEATPAYDERRDLVFFGAFWNPGSPNEDSILYLTRRIMPLILEHDPAVRLVIIGADPTPAVHALDGALNGSIIVRGYVRDPSDVLLRARVHVAPLRIGAGLKLRLIDSMAAGLPFVTTTVGAEGLSLTDVAAHVVADTPIEIARRVLALYHDRQLWTRVQQRLRTIASSQYSAASLRAQIARAMEAVGWMAPTPAGMHASADDPPP